MSFRHGDLTFRFVTIDHRLTGLVVETDSVVLAPFNKPSPTTHAHLPLLRSPAEPLLPRIEQELRALRGALALWGVIDINIDYPATEFFPETEDEKSNIDVLGHAFKPQARDELPPMPGAPDMLVRCALARHKFAEYELPLDLYRRGSEHCYHQRYINAIVNFFFILEYLFGEGKYATAELTRSFTKSSAFREALEEARDSTMRIASLQPQERWARKITLKYCESAIEQATKKIVNLRGFLHHQSLKREKTWNLSIQSEFDGDALFLHRLCQSLLTKISTDILFEDDAKKEFLATTVFSTDNKRINWVPADASHL